MSDSSIHTILGDKGYSTKLIMDKAIRRLLSEGALRAAQRVLLRPLEEMLPFVAEKSNYHELSFLKTGDPLEALAYHATDPSSDLEPPLFVEPGQVRIDVLAAPWNHPADTMSVAGRHPSPYTHNQAADFCRYSNYFLYRKVAGSEGWGRVTNVSGGGGSYMSNNINSSSSSIRTSISGNTLSSLSTLQVGDYVVTGKPGLGTFRSSLWLPANAVIRLERGQELHDKVGAVNAAPLFYAGGTALRMLRDFCHLESGDVVLQNVGGSDSGNYSAVHFMVSQFAATMGLKLVSLVRRGTLSPDQFLDLVNHLTDFGADSYAVAIEDLLDSSDAMKEFQADLRDLSPDRPPLLAVNAVDGPSAATLLKVLGPGGTMVTHGGMSLQPIEVSVADLIYNDVKTAGYWHNRWLAQLSTVDQRTSMMNELVDAVLDGTIDCPPVEAFALSEFKEAIEFEAKQSGEAVRRQVVFDCRLQR